MSDPYEPPTFDTPIDLDLSRNEGRPTITEIGLGPTELAAITSRYPETSGLRAVVAVLHGLPESRVLVTAGGDDALFRCFLSNAGGPTVATTPSFEMIRRYAQQVGSQLTELGWWGEDFPVDDFLDEATGVGDGMAVVVSPNNPTGNVIDQADLRKLSGAFPLVVLDCAYTEFASEDLTSEALTLDNVVVIRTLSKAYGLAGLRVGYLLGPEDLVARLAAFGSPYAMSSLSAVLATEVLTERSGSASSFVREVAGERDRLIALLNELGCSPLPSQANFVLATDVDPSWLVPAAASLGIGLRRFDDREDLARSVRIGLPGDPVQFSRLDSVLRTIFGPQALLFDMDGVIADVRDSFRAAIVETARAFGVAVTGADIAAAKARGDASDDWELTRGLCAAAGVELGFEEVREVFERIYQGDGATPGLKAREELLVETAKLEEWSSRLPLGIVTARPRRDAEAFLERFGVERFFSTVVSREDAPSKPDPAPVRLAIERLGVSRAWMVGDTIDDLRAARRAGILPIGVAVPGDDPSALTGAARIMESVHDLEEVLDVTTI
jgi:histidinol-phosphate aminotransferase